MRFHVVGLPHTQTDGNFNVCAYTNKVVNFCKMATNAGHEVFLYSGELNTAPCTEHVSLISEAERAKIVGDQPYVNVPFNENLPFWIRFNLSAVVEIKQRLQPRDFVCIIGGGTQQIIGENLKDAMVVEYGIGYGHTFAKFRAFESYAWMHMHLGRDNANHIHNAEGKFYDAVIPGYFDPAEFPELTPAPTKPYQLFIGRLIPLKGWEIAVEATARAKKKLILAGPGDPGNLPPHVEHVGVVNSKRRNELMGRAEAVWVPTRYVEPFGNVAVEAMACGTPVITTDFGAFTETVQDEITGFRCHTMHEFLRAANMAKSLDRKAIRHYAHSRYAMDRVWRRYEQWFVRLLGLYEGGWNAS